MKVQKLLAVMLVVLLVSSALAGCSAKATENDLGYFNADGYYDKESAMQDDLTAAVPNGESALQTNQKLIRTVYLSAETEEMDALLSAVEQRIAELQGYVENREVYNGSSYASNRYRYAELVIRIPADKLDQFINHMDETSNIVSSRETTENVTLDYVATQSRITALETEQTRLLELLAKAETMEDLLLIEARLTEVRAELEQVVSQLRLYDNLVDYGTICLNITEVRQYTVVNQPETVWERISTGFVDSLKGLGTGITEIFIFLIVALPYIAVGALCIAALILGIKVLRKKRRMKKLKQTPPEPPKE